MMKTSKLMMLLFFGTALITGCSKDDNNDVPEEVNPEEVITTMNVTLTAPGGDVVTFQSRDLDGDGPKAPEITVSGSLTANTIYNGTIQMLNEQANPSENVTEEIMDEANMHQFFFQKSSPLNAAFAYADKETDYPEPDDHEGRAFSDDPVGIAFTLATVEVSTGTVSITLIHQPDKDASGVPEGDITNAAGEVDFTATFPVNIE